MSRPCAMALALAFCALPAYADDQTSISGRVLTADGEPVEGALVEAPAAHARISSDTDGRFRLDGLPYGEVRLIVKPPSSVLAGGEETVFLAPDQENRIELVLAASAGGVYQSVVVTGGGSESLLQDAPIRTELITSALVDRQVKTTLTEALTATIPGIRVENNCANCGTNAVRINGLEGGYTQILEDSLPSYSGVQSIYGLDQVPTAFIEQVEIVKGGNSALYGPNAVAGVINLISKEPRDFYLRLDSQTGWHKGRPETQYGAAAQLVDLPGGLRADLYYRGIQRTQIDRDRDGFTERPRRDLQAGGGSLYKRFFDGAAQLRLTGSSTDEFRRGGSQLDRRPENTLVTEQLLTGRSLVAARWQHSVSPTTFYNLASSFSYLGRYSYYGANFDPNAYGSTRNPLWVSDAQVGHTQGKHTFLGGYQFWREYVDDSIPAYNRSINDLFTNSGLYAQDEMRLSPGLIVVAGFRADKSNVIDHWIFSPRGSLRLALTPNLTWRAGVSTGFRAPVIFDEDLHVALAGGEGFVIERGPGLKEERSLSLQTGLDYLGSVGGRRYQVGANFFSTRLSNNHQLQEVEAAGFRKLIRVNGSGSQVRGIDLNANFNVTSRFGIRGGMAFQAARFDEPEPQFNSLSFFRTPNRYGFIGADWDLPGAWEVVFTGDYTGPMPAPHYAGFIAEDRLERTRPFFVPSFVVSKLFRPSEGTTMRWFLSARNVTDDFQRDIDQGPLRDVGYVYGPSQMRQITLGATVEF